MGKYDLIEALEDNDMDRFEKMLEEGADPNKRYEGWPILVSAINAKNIRAVRALLKHGANPNVTKREKLYPLHSAAAEGSIEMVNLLLEFKADIDMPDGLEKTTALMMGARSGNVDLVRRLLAAGADVNAEDHAGCTPLFWSFQDRDQPEVMKVLLENGANPSHTISAFPGKSLVQIAKDLNREETVRILKEAGEKAKQGATTPPTGR